MGGGELSIGGTNGLRAWIGRLGRREQLFSAVVVLTSLLAVVLVLLFDVVREIPPSTACWGSALNGNEEAVATYRDGSIPLHAFTALCALIGLVLLAAWRWQGSFRSGPRRVRTIAIVIALLAIALAATYVLALFVALGLVLAAQPLGPQMTGAVAVVLLGAGAVIVCRNTILGHLSLAGAWLAALLVLTSGHFVLVWSQGHQPIAC